MVGGGRRSQRYRIQAQPTRRRMITTTQASASQTPRTPFAARYTSAACRTRSTRHASGSRARNWSHKGSVIQDRSTARRCEGRGVSNPDSQPRACPPSTRLLPEALSRRLRKGAPSAGTGPAPRAAGPAPGSAGRYSKMAACRERGRMLLWRHPAAPARCWIARGRGCSRWTLGTLKSSAPSRCSAEMPTGWAPGRAATIRAPDPRQGPRREPAHRRRGRVVLPPLAAMAAVGHGARPCRSSMRVTTVRSWSPSP
jgi:hypothetical protein